MRHVFKTMGTVASLELPTRDDTAFSQVERLFHDADRRFSLYRPASELNEIALGRLALVDASDELRKTYAEALDWRRKTDGAFTPNRPDGVTDLNGVVKAIAIAGAGAVITSLGYSDWSLNVGGDVLTAGLQPDLRPWTIGVADPDDRSKLLCSLVLRGSRKAVASSGSAERGDHIWARGTLSHSPFRQVTVLARDIVDADVFATAIASGGRRTLDSLSDSEDIDVLVVEASGSLLATPGIWDALAEPLGRGGQNT
jgi:thiamine biosynthesis lipoprotein